MQVSLLTHDLFANDPFSEREAWLWIISQAAWRDTKHRVGKQLYDVKIGTFFSTVRQMQEAWKWASTRRVHEFLNLLKAETMIETRIETGKTLISVCNYSQYQTDYGNPETGFGTETETELKHKRHQYTNIDNSLRSLSLEEPQKKKRKTGTRLPDDWQVSEALTEWIRSKKYSRNFVLREIEKFKNFWAAKAGKDGIKLDWDATARNWLLRAAERETKNGKAGTVGDTFVKLARDMGVLNDEQSNNDQTGLFDEGNGGGHSSVHGLVIEHAEPEGSERNDFAGRLLNRP